MSWICLCVLSSSRNLASDARCSRCDCWLGQIFARIFDLVNETYDFNEDYYYLLEGCTLLDIHEPGYLFIGCICSVVTGVS